MPFAVHDVHNGVPSGCLAVARVDLIVDRAVGQVARRKAFSCINDITSQKHPDYGPALRRAMKDRTWPVALQMVDHYVAGHLGPDITGGATHYCIHPPKSWQTQMVFTRQIGVHRFFREGES